MGKRPDGQGLEKGQMNMTTSLVVRSVLTFSSKPSLSVVFLLLQSNKEYKKIHESLSVGGKASPLILLSTSLRAKRSNGEETVLWCNAMLFVLPLRQQDISKPFVGTVPFFKSIKSIKKILSRYVSARPGSCT